MMLSRDEMVRIMETYGEVTLTFHSISGVDQCSLRGKLQHTGWTYDGFSNGSEEIDDVGITYRALAQAMWNEVYK